MSLCKSELYGQLGLAKPEAGKPFPPGYVHIPRLGWVPDMPLDEFCRQLTAEQYVIKTVKGNKRGEWVKRRPRNEGLDTSNLARAAAEHFGISRFTDAKWKSLEAQFASAIAAMPSDPELAEFELVAPTPGEQQVSTPIVQPQLAPQPRALPAIPPRPVYRPIVSEDPYLS
ncbi:MAG: phage terminase large subunit family protein [Paludibaculum sp.]